jgi:site-specific recombinase XerD
MFLTSYMAGLRNLSFNTIKSYRDTFVLLLDFIKHSHEISPEKITIKFLDKNIIEEFLRWLETSRNNAISTRNQRLAGIHAFFRYLQGEKPEYLFHCQKILSIPIKRTPKPVIGYLSENAMKSILKMPDKLTFTGRRDLTLLCTLYDTGARAQELADLTVRNIRLSTPSLISITGKGNKTRHVPIMKQTENLLKSYIKEHKLDTTEKLDSPLFSSNLGKKLTRQGIAYIVAKYSDTEELDKISPHIYRHTKAMHMTQADINPVYIRDFLGHADLKTTEIYSKSNIEMKRKALEKLQNDVIPSSNINWNTDGDLMTFLNSLK